MVTNRRSTAPICEQKGSTTKPALLIDGGRRHCTCDGGYDKDADNVGGEDGYGDKCYWDDDGDGGYDDDDGDDGDGCLMVMMVMTVMEVMMVMR